MKSQPLNHYHASNAERHVQEAEKEPVRLKTLFVLNFLPVDPMLTSPCCVIHNALNPSASPYGQA